jgi:hypothetical protein
VYHLQLFGQFGHAVQDGTIKTGMSVVEWLMDGWQTTGLIDLLVRIC